MNPSQLSELMHIVLDGEATSDERRALEAALARDPSARSDFEELRRLFDGMKAVPQRFPPEGLVASLVAKMRSAQSDTDSDQLFGPSGVFEPNLKKSRGRLPGQGERNSQASKPWTFSRGDRMNQQRTSFSAKRKLLVGGGIAAAAVIVALSTGVFPPGGNDIAGTIVPAERYRAPQITADDVKVGDQASGGGTVTATPGEGQGSSVNAMSATPHAMSGTVNAMSATHPNAVSGSVNDAHSNAMSGSVKAMSATPNAMSGSVKAMSATPNAMSGTELNALNNHANAMSGSVKAMSATPKAMSGTELNALNNHVNAMSGSAVSSSSHTNAMLSGAGTK